MWREISESACKKGGKSPIRQRREISNKKGEGNLQKEREVKFPKRKERNFKEERSVISRESLGNLGGKSQV